MADYSWASHLDSLEGIEDVGGTRLTSEKKIGPGVTLAVGVAVAAWLVSRAPFWPFTNAAGGHPVDAIVIATMGAIFIANIRGLAEHRRAGVAFASRKLLPVSVVLLGARLDFTEMLVIGAWGILLSCGLVGLALLGFATLGRWWKFSRMEALLLGVGTAICGGTAIVAVAPVVRAKQAEVVLAVTTVTLVGLGAMFVLPVAGALLELDAETFGMWAGLVIHQTPQVVVAGFAHGPEAGQVATVVKLARVCLLAPLIVGLGLWWSRWGEGGAGAAGKPWWKHIPWFVFGFAAMALSRTLGLLPELDVTWNTSRVFPPLVLELSLQDLCAGAAAFLLVVAMAGVGLETRLSMLRRSSLRAVAAAVLVSVGLAGLVLMVL
jgi:uncharacterized integral membrane protein (TIGR00698 family)